MTAYKSINPFTGELLKDFSLHTENEVSEKVKSSKKAFSGWRSVELDERIRYIKEVQTKLTSKKEEFAKLITIEMGKPINESRVEIDKCISLCDYYMTNVKGFLITRTIVSSEAEVEIHHQPLGTILAIMPWNFPFWQVFRFAIPNLLVGNVCLQKHAPNVPQCALAIERLFLHAKYDLFVNLFVSNQQVEKLIKNDVVQGITLTGSNRAGEAVGKNAGEQIKKVVLELGGNDAFVVLEDADLDRASDKLLASRLLNTGQSCIGSKRLIIASQIKDEFLGLFIKKLKNYVKLGDPILEEVNIGVIARKDLKSNLLKQVDAFKNKGGEVLFVYENNTSSNSFPVILLNTTKISTNDRNIELFGPVLQVITFENEEEVTTFVNETSFGLGCSIWTMNSKKAKKISLLIDTGSVFINEMVFSSPYFPFGGVKKSGVGRELGKEGMLEFTNMKTVYTKK